MRVKLELEFEINEAPEETKKRTTEELLNSLRMIDSDIVDGFELTTKFADGDNTNDFYIVPQSAKILSKGIIGEQTNEFRKDQLVVSDMEVNDEGNGVSSYLETWFDVEKKFGVNVEDDDTWVNFYAEYYPKSEELKCTCVVSKPDASDDFEYIPTENEKALIISMLEEYCIKNNNMCIKEMIDDMEQDSVEMTM